MTPLATEDGASARPAGGGRARFFSVCALGLAIAALTAGLWMFERSGRPAAPGARPSVARPDGQLLFATPFDAMQTVCEVCRTHDKASFEKLFGAGAAELIWSGDEAVDREDSLRVIALIEARLAFVERSPDSVTAELGDDKWPFPIPLVKTSEGWRFDLGQGASELISRRIGDNELETIDTMYECAAAQKEYFAIVRDGEPPAYAERVRSTPGRKDGLYWPSRDDEPESPLGDLVAAAAKEASSGSEAPRPFQGYYYKILTGQGPNAPGGRKSYLDRNGLMTAGFAAIAWPADYGRSGTMTFAVGNAGVVFQKDLGGQTAEIAGSMTEYDPDQSWSPVRRPPAREDR